MSEARAASFDVYQRFVEILEIEAAAITSCALRADASTVDRAIELLYNCTGKVVILGVGKSGVIGQKIAQTMTSTGTAAIYVHPSDALHGNLGLISPGDVVLAISNSGETDELLAILPSIRKRSAAIISIIGDLDSSLGRQSDVVLDASVDKEACPLNLAPTASTTAALALGDGLAMALMERKGLTPEAFAINHPAGRLGKRLTVTVSDLMCEGPNLSPGDNWFTVLSHLSRYALGAVTVVDETGSLTGIVTDGDVRRTAEKIEPEKLAALSASEMMTHAPISITLDELAYDALQLMENRPRQISVLPVVDSRGICMGLIRLHDIVRAGL